MRTSTVTAVAATAVGTSAVLLGVSALVTAGGPTPPSSTTASSAQEQAAAGKAGAPPPAGNNFWLSDLEWVSATNRWGPVEKDTSNGENAAGDGNPITLNGRVFEKGLGVVPASTITYDLGGRCSRFLTVAGIDDEVDTRGVGGTVVFQVVADGEKVFDSGVVFGEQWSDSVLEVDTEAVDIDLDVSGVETLELRTDPWYDGISNDHADWAGARVVCSQAP